ncbi:hypothetical protein [Streptomyces sp. BBFR102]|uniref:hypothetical protein n=1 Tax=Streptomyces sp. BBFR102 TaxID=3448171 RepID=UPI003F534AB0
MRREGDARAHPHAGHVRVRPLPWLRGRHAVRVLPTPLLVLIVLGDLATGSGFRVITWVVIVPALTAALAGVRATAVFSALSLGACLLVDRVLRPGPEAELPGLLLVAVGGVASVAACAVRQADERRAARLSLAADVIRDTVLRPLPPRWGGLDRAALYVPADHVARVGRPHRSGPQTPAGRAPARRVSVSAGGPGARKRLARPRIA